MQEALVAGENRIFRADFATRRSIQDLGGVIVACSVPGAGGVSPTGATGRITFYGTQSLAVKATKMTIALRIRTPAANNAAQTILVAKSPSALNANQWHLTIEANRILRLYVANAAGDTGQFISLNGALSVSTEYAIHAVFDGTLAVGSRAALFLSGAVAASTISGTIPAAMTPGIVPVSVLNLNGGTASAPATDTILRTVSIYPGVAFSDADVQQDFLNNLSSGVTP